MIFTFIIDSKKPHQIYKAMNQLTFMLNRLEVIEMDELRGLDKMIADLHKARREVDVNIVKIQGFKQTSMNQLAGRELEHAYTKLQEAKMWLGKCLEAIGSELPKEFTDKAE